MPGVITVLYATAATSVSFFDAAHNPNYDSDKNAHPQNTENNNKDCLLVQAFSAKIDTVIWRVCHPNLISNILISAVNTGIIVSLSEQGHFFDFYFGAFSAFYFI